MADDLEEEWRDAVGYEGLYQISNLGRVKSNRSKTRIVDKNSHIMKEKLDNRGYKRVNLYKDGRCKAELVSRLVANAFIPNPDGLPYVGHGDDIKTNNRVHNLYWTDPKENNRHNGKLERFHKSHKENIDLIAEKLSIKIKGTSLDESRQIRFKSIQEAKRAGFDNGKISMCINGKRNTHKGYRWEREE